MSVSVTAAAVAAAAAAAAHAIRFTRPYVNGKCASALQPYSIRCPSTETHLTTIQANVPGDIDSIVASARSALNAGPWGTAEWTGVRRRHALNAIADLIHTHSDHFAWLETLTGKPTTQSYEDIHACEHTLRYFASHADQINGRTYAFDAQFDSYTLKEPIGVCGLITSFNYPLLLAIWKIAPALAAGNTVIIKPAPQTPLSTLYLAQVIHEAGILPPGVFNVVLGGADIGQALALHSDVNLISFTGSSHVGRLVAISCAQASPPHKCMLELGGKNCVIVCADAELDLAVESVVDAAFANMGQNCCAASRLLLHRDIHDEFLTMLKKRTEALVIGDPFDKKTSQGPLIDQRQFESVSKFIELANATDAIRVISGGGRVGPIGYFLQPMILSGVPDNSPLATDEIFGPILSVLQPFDTIEEAVARANKSAHGLAAGVWTNNLKWMQFATRRLNVGMVWQNYYNDIPPYLPLGGRKQSGYGTDLGIETLEAMMVTKSVHSAR
ncbi:hypothetical protein BASA50_006496 [Batrachochytrium salamandrivorans]|uniref:Aldehyde dehydrogenase domain-containing protein n=1 Tax=Batrachochytrium salamandrivorans TaxID=1357716 RepID=A0ABQ8FAW6_9FUNG|nr:hypothetical protein BASA61_004853 [Batrachochytrium salamandrivorans]KAH6594546.1 hypothetical protein BASA50_006496 [Batrachochytrium salamandrivorans]